MEIPGRNLKPITTYQYTDTWLLMARRKKRRRASGLYTQFPDFGMRKYL
jgi:hypothetical protein